MAQREILTFRQFIERYPAFTEATVLIRRNSTWARLPDDESKPAARFFPPKTKAGRRTLPLAPPLLHQLKLWKLQCPPTPDGLVFPGPDGTALHRGTALRDGLYPTCERAKIRRVSMLVLRHTFASQLLMGGAPLLEVQHFMGHRDATTTLKVYSHFIPRQETDRLLVSPRRFFPTDTL